MFKIHKKLKYALSALKHMAHSGENGLVTAKEICSKYDIPFDPTSRVLQLMAQQGILKAEQGAYGGYRLAGDLGKLTVYELSRTVVGEFSVTDCAAAKASCDRLAHCVLKEAMVKLNAKVVKTFKDVAVTEMI